MTALIKNSQASGVEAYEDMFKEITKKLYGEEASQSLHTPMAHITPDVERSITNLLSDRNVTSGEFDHGALDTNNTLRNDDHLTALGLAALMQNGFSTPNSLLNNHTFQQVNKLNPSNSSMANSLSTNASNSTTIPNSSTESTPEKCTPHHGSELNTWNSKPDVYQNTSKYYKSKKHESPSHDVNNQIKTDIGLTNNGNNSTNESAGLQKRFNCSNCPYSTDRRDLFTRHENIHKEDKPFYCYICLKQFNRADHVKKHFLRIHRGLAYDIGRTKRSVLQTKSKKPNISGTASNYSHHVGTSATYHTAVQNQHQQLQQQNQQQQMEPSSVNIDQTNQHMTNTFHTFGTTSTHLKDEKLSKKNEKRFLCCYCSWSGNDNWGLKRHLNTHLKPYLCVLCDYKAARSERLTTHVLKVHNKKVCTKCNYLAVNQSEYDVHVAEVHSNETRTQRTNQSDSRSTVNNAMRNVNNNNEIHATNSFCIVQNSSPDHTFGNWRTTLSETGVNSSNLSKLNGNNGVNQKSGAERLFQYFEADDSDPEDYARQQQMVALSRNTASVAQDFHNAGGETNNELMSANYQVSDNIIMIERQLNDLTVRIRISPPANQTSRICLKDIHHQIKTTIKFIRII